MTQIRLREAMSSVREELTESTSIPSLFHQDLALLWALEAESSETLPAMWTDQVLAWKRLLANWLLDNVREQTVEVGELLKRHIPLAANPKTRFDRVTWMFEKPDGVRPVGVRSSVTIVRPVDFRAPVAPLSRSEPWKDARCLQLIDRLKRVLMAEWEKAREVESTQLLAAHVKRLRAVLDRHFPDAPRSFTGTLRSLGANVVLVAPGHDPEGLNWVSFDVARLGGIRSQMADVLFPECTACGKVALPLELELQDGVTNYEVACPSCSTAIAIDVEEYRCGWLDGTERPGFIVWLDTNFIWAERQPHLPPVPTVSEVEAEFVYEPGHPRIAAIREADRHLKFVVGAGKGRFRPIVLREVCHERLLWPVARDSSEGRSSLSEISPLRVELQGLARRRDTRPRFEPARDPLSGSVTFTLDLIGVPSPVRFRAAKVYSLEMPGLVAYPDPGAMPPGWKWFRLATSDHVEIRVPGSTGRSSGLRSVCTVDDGMPSIIELIGPGDPKSGCTVTISAWSRDEGGHLPIDLGVDVGRSASVVVARCSSDASAEATPFCPGGLRHGAVRWLIEPSAESSESILDSIFGEAFDKESSVDTALVPTELCGHKFIRWGAMPCCRQDDIRIAANSDPAAPGAFSTFLVELLIHALADFIGRSGSRPSHFHASPRFAIQPGLESYARDQHFWSARDAWKRVLSLTGAEHSSATFVPANESAAIASEPPRTGEMVLTADLGGGSLDVAVGVPGEKAGYLGSVVVGTHRILERIASGAGHEPYHLLDDLRIHPSRQKLAHPTLRVGIRRYFAVVLTFLETVLLGHLLRSGKVDEPCNVAIYLFGNGWRLAGIDSADIDDRVRAFESVLQHFWMPRLQSAILNAGHVGVTLELRLPENPAEMKVAVARGAIAASSPQAWPQAYLPAGIAFTENAPGRYRVAWSDPIGPGRDDDSAAARAIDAGVHFEFDELGARLERSPVFAETGCAPDCSASDGEIRRALADSENRVPGTVGQMIVRGPLQVLLEKVWIPGSS